MLHYGSADHQNTFCVYGFSIKAQIVIINRIHFNIFGKVVGEYIRGGFLFTGRWAYNWWGWGS